MKKLLFLTITIGLFYGVSCFASGGYKLTNQIKNGDFENSPTFIAPLSTSMKWVDGTLAGSDNNDFYSWHFVEDANQCEVRFSTSTEVYSGKYALKLSNTDITGRCRVVMGTNNGTGATRDKNILNKWAIKVMGSVNYSISHWIKTLNVPEVSSISVHEFNNTGTRLANPIPAGTSAGTNNWTYKSGSFTTPSNTAYLVLSVQNGAAGAIADTWFDDIRINMLPPTAKTSNKVLVRYAYP